MRLKSFALCLILFSVVSISQAKTVYYWTTPYPVKGISQDINKVHIWDGWLPSVYYDKKFIRDEKLQIGGWGDKYRVFIKYDLTGLPKNPDLAALYLRPYDRGDTSDTTTFAMCKIGSAWNLSMTWDTQPTFPTCWGWYNPPVIGNWWGVNFTSLYNEWKNGVTANNGVMLFTQTNNNEFNVFRSSRYKYGYGPVLRFDFTPTLEISMPLPGNHEWFVTTETGGYDCNGTYDQYHDDNNYFSIDFSSGNNADSGATTYSSSSDIPVLAVADGKVVKSEFNSYNGNYVVIDHDEDSNLNTGFSTWYLHFKYYPSVFVGDVVKKGEVIGYMGNTGISFGTHLHFGVRYKNNGSASVPELAKVLMEGHLLKGYQTECSLNSKGEPISPKRYYRSYNTAY